MNSRMTGVALLFAIVCLALSTIANTQDAAPVLRAAGTGDQTVLGRATVGVSAVSLYDVSVQPKQLLGESRSIDAAGEFAIAVPSLREGQQLVATDDQGRSSDAVLVETRRDGPTSPQ